MKVIKVGVGLVLALVLLLNQGTFAQDLAPDPQTLWIAVSEDAERWPAVARGTDAEVVVYVKKDSHGNDAIYASVISPGQENPLRYPISDFEGNCDHPVIAYQAASGWFVIVYACDASQILTQAFEPTTEVVGPTVTISADEGIPKANPAVACNQIVGSCLVAFQYDHSRVKGAYVDVDSWGIMNISPVYDLSDATTSGGPHLAWGKGVGTYLVAYSEQHSTGGILPGYTHVMDHDDPLAAIKYLHPSTPAVPHDFSAPGYDALVSDVAYDPCTQKFLISFDYDAAGDGSDYDVWAAVVHATNPINITALPIADSQDNEHSGAISFVSGDHQPPSCGTMDRLLVGYINQTMGLMAVELHGNSSPSNPVYTCDAANQHLLIESHTEMSRNTAVTLSSGFHDRRMLMVYEVYFSASEDYDLWGKFVGQLDRVYLPLVLR